jgi:hypothetical protein
VYAGQQFLLFERQYTCQLGWQSLFLESIAIGTVFGRPIDRREGPVANRDRRKSSVPQKQSSHCQQQHTLTGDDCYPSSKLLHRLPAYFFFLMSLAI